MFTDNNPGFFAPSGGNNYGPGGFSRENKGGQSYGGGQQQQQQRKNQVFVPVTLKMLNEAPVTAEDNLEIDGAQISEIIIVGRVISRTEESMRVVLEVNDNTDTVKVIFYQKDQGQLPTALKHFEYKQFAYAKIFGTIRVYKEEKAIVGTHVRRIEKFEEVTNHYLQTFVAHQVRTKGILTSKDFAQVEQPRASTGPMTSQPAKPMAISGGGDAIQTIIGLMRNFPSKIVHRDDIESTLKNQFDRGAVGRAIDRLLGDGTIYTAHSDDTFILDE